MVYQQKNTKYGIFLSKNALKKPDLLDFLAKMSIIIATKGGCCYERNKRIEGK